MAPPAETIADVDPAEAPRKQREIVSTATHLFKRFGVKRVSVEEICREAGVSKATFYKYFSNKVELVKYIFSWMSAVSHRKTDEIQALDVPFSQKVRMLIDYQLEHTRRTSDAFIKDFYEADAELAQFIQELTERNQRRFLAFITDAQERGDVRPEIQPDFVLAVLQKLNELAADDGLRRMYTDYVELTREIVDFFFHGLMSQSGRG